MSPNAAIVEAAFSFLGVPFFNKGSFCVTKGIGGEAFSFACDNKVVGWRRRAMPNAKDTHEPTATTFFPGGLPGFGPKLPSLVWP